MEVTLVRRYTITGIGSTRNRKIMRVSHFEVRTDLNGSADKVRTSPSTVRVDLLTRMGRWTKAREVDPSTEREDEVSLLSLIVLP